MEVAPGSCRARKPGKKGGKAVKPQTAVEIAKRREALRESLRQKLELEQKALRIVERLLEDSVTDEFLVDCARFITPANYTDTVEERSIAKMCGYPLCSNKLVNVPKQQYKISTKTNRVYDITERKCFCSNFCYSASKYFSSQISKTPLWLRGDERPPDVQLLQEGESGRSGEEVKLAEQPVTEGDIENPGAEMAPPTDSSDSEGKSSDSEQEFVSSVVSGGRSVPMKTQPGEQTRTGRRPADKKRVTFRDTTHTSSMETRTSVNSGGAGELRHEGEEERRKCTAEETCLLLSSCSLEGEGAQAAPPLPGQSPEQLAANTPPTVNAPPTANAPPGVNAPPTANALPSVNAPPTANAPPGVNAPPTANALPSVNAPPTANAPPSVNAPPTANSPPGVKAPPTANAPPGVNAPPTANSPPGVNAPPIANAPPNPHTPPTSNAPPTTNAPTAVHAPSSANQGFTQVGMSRKGAAGLRGLLGLGAVGGGRAGPQALRTTMLEGLRSTLTEWRTQETLHLLYGPGYGSWDVEEEPDEDELDEDDLEECVEDPVKRPAGTLGGRAITPVPDYETLRKETEQLTLRVREFYGECTLPEEAGLGAEPADKGVEPPPSDALALPLVDSRSQHVIQKSIVMEKLCRSLRDVVGPLGLTMNDVTADISNLVRTFRFTSSNIIHKSPEWTLMAVVFLLVLAVVSPVLRGVLGSPSSVGFMSTLMRELTIEEQELQGLVGIFRRPVSSRHI